jgi:hypothetical protein
MFKAALPAVLLQRRRIMFRRASGLAINATIEAVSFKGTGKGFAAEAADVSGNIQQVSFAAHESEIQRRSCSPDTPK